MRTVDTGTGRHARTATGPDTPFLLAADDQPTGLSGSIRVHHPHTGIDPRIAAHTLITRMATLGWDWAGPNRPDDCVYWGTGQRPIYCTQPVPDGANPGHYVIRFGSPYPSVTAAVAVGVERHRATHGALHADTGRLRIVEVRTDPPATSTGTDVWVTGGPVIAQVNPAATALRPDQAGYEAALERIWHRKAVAAGCDPDVTIRVLEAVNEHTFDTTDGVHPGASIAAQIVGAPETVTMMRHWGLGAYNLEGFGWVK